MGLKLFIRAILQGNGHSIPAKTISYFSVYSSFFSSFACIPKRVTFQLFMFPLIIWGLLVTRVLLSWNIVFCRSVVQFLGMLKYGFLSSISRIDMFLCWTANRYLAFWYACGMCEGLSGTLYTMKT